MIRLEGQPGNNNFETSTETGVEAGVSVEEKAYAYIEFVRQQTAVMGANDRESSDLNDIRDRLGNGQLTPQEAIEEAGAVLDQKMDYH